MTTESHSRSTGLFLLFIGLISGALAAAAIRHAVYIGLGDEPNMHPGMGYYFFPILALPLGVLVGLMHVLGHKFFAYVHSWQWLLAGVGYGLWFLAFLGPAFLVSIAIFNPLVFRVLTARRA